MDTKDILLKAISLKKSFQNVHALVDGTISIEKGVITALVGSNGAGKSTLIKCITGDIRPDGGSIAIGGETLTGLTTKEARARGIATVYQDLALVDVLDVASNIYLGMEPTKWGVIRRREMVQASKELLGRFSIDLPVTATLSSLSGGQRQAVALARAIAQGGDILVLDEPTAAMGVVERERIMGILRKLRDQGQAILYISHDLDQVLDLTDQVVVSRSGRTVAHLASSELDPLSLAGWISGAIGP
ncbi:MAG: ATP-binding cassette domain-containing protein [Dethiosulfovibrio sp.]|nr:ATP-binding cassette domain-containing protein [Dethiosulfovibrio sp.]